MTSAAGTLVVSFLGERAIELTACQGTASGASLNEIIKGGVQ
jgi:hypothetical protein